MSVSSIVAERTQLLKSQAFRLGFSFVGVSKAEKMDEEAKRLEAWLNKGMHGEMGYMANHFDKRIDPRQLVPGAKSVISFAYPYYTDQKQSDPQAPKISKYAYGEDYHFVLKRKLKDLLAILQQEIGAIEGRCFVDSAPVLERDWARRSGLGWIGKNTLLIHPKAGSYFFLAELIIDVELEYDSPMRDYCGTCTRCIDACPTKAISEDGYWVDGSKCISYLTIELKSSIPDEFKGKMENWMFGCDVCQEVCPWNRFAKPHDEPTFRPHPDLLEMPQQAWVELTEEIFSKVFKRSAVKRSKYTGLKRNIDFLAFNS